MLAFAIARVAEAREEAIPLPPACVLWLDGSIILHRLALQDKVFAGAVLLCVCVCVCVCGVRSVLQTRISLHSVMF